MTLWVPGACNSTCYLGTPQHVFIRFLSWMRQIHEWMNNGCGCGHSDSDISWGFGYLGLKFRKPWNRGYRFWTYWSGEVHLREVHTKWAEKRAKDKTTDIITVLGEFGNSLVSLSKSSFNGAAGVKASLYRLRNEWEVSKDRQGFLIIQKT